MLYLMFHIEPEVNVLPIKVDVEWMIFDDFVVCVSQPGRRLVPPPGELYQTYRRRIDWLIDSVLLCEKHDVTPFT